MIKYGHNILTKPIATFFNLVIHFGYYPDNWFIGRIILINKKGDINNPVNYRGITISSALGKLFKSIPNNRLCHFLETKTILCESRVDFKRIIGPNK